MTNSTNELQLLADGRWEQKLAVDRKRLEAMITGIQSSLTPVALPRAEQFFSEVMLNSNAEICWPSQLKVGAKTKKDPFVKIIGNPMEIEKAADMIKQVLKVKKERVVAKMEIHHSTHSNIIGRGGRGIQKIMALTSCHIHFPDSNKYTESTSKSDQVSISGHPQDIEAAVRKLRDLSTVILYFDLPLPPASDATSAKSTSLFAPQLSPDVSLSFHVVSNGFYSCSLKANAGDELAIFQTIDSLAKTSKVQAAFSLTVRLQVELREDSLAALRKPQTAKRLTELAQQLSVHLQLEDALCLSGPVSGVLLMRKTILGLSQLTLSFEVPSNELNGAELMIDKQVGMIVNTKNKPGNNEITCVSIRSVEENLPQILAYRDLLVRPADQIHHDQDLEPTIPAEVFSTLPQLLHSPEPSTPSLVPLSPDPDASPLAASILRGAKERNGEIWTQRTKGDRDKMLFKATQAIFDDTPRSKPLTRYPTDLWAGYGFSCSLPADLLKGLFNGDECEEGPPEGRPILGRDSKTPPRTRELSSVLEEDEVGQLPFDASASTTSFHLPPQYHAKPCFSNSTSFFDTGVLRSDFSWDIRHFSEPAMVLAQLGCSEYLVLLREQEIDMRAFLLLDAQSLKEIGISTIGARKKIHHAILKLRESAREHGYTI